jgi:glycosyltransferase involved in cell wall biosynthesis
VAHACYRGSLRDTLGAAAAAAAHSAAGTWREGVDAFVVLSELARRKFVRGGLPADRIAVRPNFLADDPGPGAHAGGFALFVGRLSEEKGVRTLLRAWQAAGGRLPLKVVGAGPLEGEVARAGPGVAWLGARPRAEVLALMRDASFLVFPSECYENFPLVVAEAFATGLPVLVADGGAAAEVVMRHRAGFAYRAGDAYLLAVAADWLRVAPDRRAEMGAAARAAFLAEYTSDRAYARLMEIYGRVLARR